MELFAIHRTGDPPMQLMSSVCSDNEGHYEAKNLDPGENLTAIFIQANHDTQPRYFLAHLAEGITLREGETTTYDFVATSGARLVVSVMTAEGSPVRGAEIRLMQGGDEVIDQARLTHGPTMTDRNGRLMYRAIPPGTYTARATLADGRKIEGTISLGVWRTRRSPARGLRITPWRLRDSRDRSEEGAPEQERDDDHEGEHPVIFKPPCRCSNLSCSFLLPMFFAYTSRTRKWPAAIRQRPSWSGRAGRVNHREYGKHHREREPKPEHIRRDFAALRIQHVGKRHVRRTDQQRAARDDDESQDFAMLRMAMRGSDFVCENSTRVIRRRNNHHARHPKANREVLAHWRRHWMLSNRWLAPSPKIQCEASVSATATIAGRTNRPRQTCLKSTRIRPGRQRRVSSSAPNAAQRIRAIIPRTAPNMNTMFARPYKRHQRRLPTSNS
jgi:hypothetical protein